jgi:hypothetical protein
VLHVGDQLTVVGNPDQSDDLRTLIEGNENGGQGSP